MALKNAYVLSIVALLTVAFFASAEDTMTGVFDERVRSLQVANSSNPYLPSVASMDSDDAVTISFDLLGEDRQYLRYRLQHCDWQWQPSQLLESEYIYGFNEGTIDNYALSQGTTVHYVHYWLDIPNENMRLVLPGNYLLTVYNEDDPDTPLLQCRIMISEQTIPIDGFVTSRTDIDYNRRHQQLELCLDVERADVDDIYNDLRVVVQQNGRYDNERAVSRPMRVSGHKAYFEHIPALIFEGGNEYRRFETVSEYYPGMGVADIEYIHPYRHFYLYTDTPRTDTPYTYDSTQHGAFTVRRQGTNDSDTEADYAVVHFDLEMPQLTDGSMIFIDGDMVQRRFDPSSSMHYNPVTGRYQHAMLLKQGSYNYQYLFVSPGATSGSTAEIEGDNYQTVNQYLIKVYYRRRGERFDRLAGVSTVYSNQ